MSLLAAYRAMTVHAATRIGRVVAEFQPESIIDRWVAAHRD